MDLVKKRLGEVRSSLRGVALSFGINRECLAPPY